VAWQLKLSLVTGKFWSEIDEMINFQGKYLLFSQISSTTKRAFLKGPTL
jgi:hypothetical protein